MNFMLLDSGLYNAHFMTQHNLLAFQYLKKKILYFFSRDLRSAKGRLK